MLAVPEVPRPRFPQQCRPGLWACAAGIFLASLVSGPAHADAIDGDWCNAGGKHMTIKGASITTPGGNAIAGTYTRHFFSYVVPAGEPGAGETVDIVLRGEYLAQSRQGGADAPAVDWRRCTPTVS